MLPYLDQSPGDRDHLAVACAVPTVDVTRVQGSSIPPTTLDRLGGYASSTTPPRTDGQNVHRTRIWVPVGGQRPTPGR